MRAARRVLCLRAMLPAAETLSSLPLCGRLTAGGPSALSDGELAALVMLSSPSEGQRVLDVIGGLHALAKAGLGDLCGAANLSVARACRLKAAFELGRRAIDEPLDFGAPLSAPELVAAHLRGRLLGLEQEEMHVLGLDNFNRLVTHFIAAVGSINHVSVSPRDVYRRVLRDGAQRLILAHNHPSGDSAPSESDRALTERFVHAGREVGLPLIDHLIFGRDGTYSFARDPERKARWG